MIMLNILHQKVIVLLVFVQVTRVALQDDGALLVTSTEALDKDHLLNEGQSEVRAKGASSEDQSETFDVVIIAAPMTQDKVTLRLTDFPEKFSFSGRYFHTCQKVHESSQLNSYRIPGFTGQLPLSSTVTLTPGFSARPRNQSTPTTSSLSRPMS